MVASFFKFLNNISRIRWLLIVLVLAYIVRVLLIGAGDFAVYYGASNALLDSKMIYHLPYPVGDSTCEYSYSPFFAFILIPLSIFPLWLADMLWLFLNLLALFRIFDLIILFLGIKKTLNQKEYKWWIFLTLLFSVRFILYNFDLSQVTLILLCGSLESLRLAIKRQWMMGGLVLSVVISIKLMPLVMLPYLFYRRFWQAGLATLGFMILLNLTPSVLYTWSNFQNLLKEWFSVLNPMSDDFTINQNVVAESIHSLSGFIPAFFTDDITRYDLRRHIINLPTETMILVMNIARLLFILFTFIFLKTKPFQAINDKKRLFWEFSYLMIAIALIFPHQQKYAFILILPAAAYLMYFILMMKKIKFYLENPLLYRGLISLLIIVWLLTTASTDGIIGRTLYEYGQYFKLITWGTMLLIIPLFLAKPQFLKRKPTLYADSEF